MRVEQAGRLSHAHRYATKLEAENRELQLQAEQAQQALAASAQQAQQALAASAQQAQHAKHETEGLIKAHHSSSVQV